MGAMASQITSLAIVYSTVYLGADQRKHQSSVSLAFVRGIHRWPVNSPHKWPVTREMSPFDDVIIIRCQQIREGFILWRLLSLTHLPLEQVAAISQTIFSDAFSSMKSFVFWLKFHWSEASNWQWPSTGLDNGFAPNRRRAIILTNADPVHRRLYAH